MRRLALPMALIVSLELHTVPVLALDRLPAPGGAASLVARVADLDRPSSARSYRHRAEAYWHWHYRAAYTRWMHNEYVRAGYPVRHRQFRTYVHTDSCCIRYRHW